MPGAFVFLLEDHFLGFAVAAADEDLSFGRSGLFAVKGEVFGIGRRGFFGIDLLYGIESERLDITELSPFRMRLVILDRVGRHVKRGSVINILIK